MALRTVSALFALSAALIVGIWAWLGAEIAMPPAPFGTGGKLYCVSYAPFHGDQTPLDLSTHIDAKQIEDDLSRLKATTDCVRTYSNDFGIDQVPGVAQRLGMKVIQGLWLSSHPERNRQQIETAVALAKKYPDTIRAIVVGNEVLLRGEMSAIQLADAIRTVKAQVRVPVTYADVWEFWLRNRDLANLVDFVTVHILPYWEDFPIPAEHAATHVDSIHRRVAAAFPGKEVLIGEMGWPSHGRMREGALPSPANQALVLHQVLTMAQRENYRVNLMEAFDQPWKRNLEGTVGGYWGLYDDATRAPKFAWGEAVSNHPAWRWQAAGGALFALVLFAAAWVAARRQGLSVRPVVWLGVTTGATAVGGCLGLAVEDMLIESFGAGGWIRSAAFVIIAAVAAIAGLSALAGRVPLPSFASLLGRAVTRPRDPLKLAVGIATIAASVLAIQSALGLAFDPRYRDFPDAALTAMAVPLFLASLLAPRPAGRRGAAETMAAGLLALCAAYIGFNESFANWQAMWFSAVLLAFAVILLRVRGAPGSESTG